MRPIFCIALNKIDVHPVHSLQALSTTSGPHLDLGRAPYVLYDVKYIDRVSPCTLHSFQACVAVSAFVVLHHSLMVRSPLPGLASTDALDGGGGGGGGGGGDGGAHTVTFQKRRWGVKLPAPGKHRAPITKPGQHHEASPGGASISGIRSIVKVMLYAGGARPLCDADSPFNYYLYKATFFCSMG